MNARTTTLLAASLLLLPTLAGAAGVVEEQQSTVQQRQNEWRTIDLPSGVDAPERVTDPYNSGVRGVWARIHNVNLYFAKDVGFHALDVTARLTPKEPGGVVDLNQLQNFTVDVAHGCALVTPEQLSALFNKHILDYSPRPLNDLAITASDGALTINGEIKLWDWFPLFWMPLYLTGPITLNDAGKLVYSPEKINALKIPARGALGATQIPLTALISLDRPGVTIDNYNIVLDVTKVFPPPAINNDPNSVEARDDGVKICFNNRPDIDLTPPAKTGDSYIWLQAGDLAALDKLLVNGKALIRPSDGGVLSFNIPRYKSRIAADGVLTMDADGTLVVDLAARSSAKNASAAGQNAQ